MNALDEQARAIQHQKELDDAVKTWEKIMAIVQQRKMPRLSPMNWEVGTNDVYLGDEDGMHVVHTE